MRGVVLLVAAALLAKALDNGLGLTPQMGWSSWNHYSCDISDEIIRRTMDAVVKTGLAQAGYQYVNIDDCWQLDRDPVTNVIIPDNRTFPNGMKVLADYAHNLGLKFGLYSAAGKQTCRGRPGSLGYEEIDAQTYASWDVDYLKYDECHPGLTPPSKRYPPMRDALNKTGRPIFFSVSEWNRDLFATWGADIGNSWRTTWDIKDHFWDMWIIIHFSNLFAKYGGPGHWNDADMLEVGNGGMTTEEYRIHFSLWAIAKAPLLIGCDVINIQPEMLEILTAPEVIAVNQDPLGRQGTLVQQDVLREVWAGPLSDGSVAVVYVNAGPYTANLTASWETVGLPAGPAVVRDLWARENVGTFEGSFSVELKTHECAMFRMTPKH